MVIRDALPSDYPPIIAMLNDWWKGRKKFLLLSNQLILITGQP